jgi:glycosyltransferase involved in cell wall biosynthesis
VQPLVTIAIPTFDRLAYLREAVASALAQTYEHIEVLIGDDGPTTTIHEWSRSIAQRDPRVRYQRNPRNLGLAGNWNALSDAARGEFLVIIGDDDRLLPNFVEKLIEIIEPRANVAFANHYVIDSRGVRLELETRQSTRRYGRDQLAAGEIADAAACVWQNSVPMSAALLRTSDVRRLRFKEDLNTPELELFARLAQEGGRFAFTPEYLSEYRTHSLSMTAAGLRGEKLVPYLSAIPVSAEVEPHKRQLIAALLVEAVGRCLQQNERELARQFLRHEYYPRPRAERPARLKHALTYYAQELCASLPVALGCGTYRFMQRIKPTG